MPAERSRFSAGERRIAVEQARALMTEQGYSANKAAEAIGEDLGVKGRTVQLWADALEMPLGELSHERAKTARANGAVVEYGQAKRQALSDLLFSRVEAVAEKTDEPGDLKDLATTFGILVDKRRLEEGKATERTETLDQRAAVDRAKQRLTSIQGGRAS